MACELDLCLYMVTLCNTLKSQESNKATAFNINMGFIVDTLTAPGLTSMNGI